MNLSQIEEEFDKRFDGLQTLIKTDQIKQFYHSRFTELLEEIKLKRIENWDEGTDEIEIVSNSKYNEAVADQNRLIQKALE